MSQQKVIIAPTVGENILLEIDSNTPVAVLRAEVSERLRVDASRLKLVYEGAELFDGANVSDFYISQLATIRAVWAVPQATSPTSAAAAAQSAGVHTTAAPQPPAPFPEPTILADGEVARSIVIRGIPPSDPAATEEAIFKAFSRFGEISRLIFQDEAAAGSAGHGATQQALLVYYRDVSAASALANDGSLLMGAPIRVQLARSLIYVQPPGAGRGDPNVLGGRVPSGTPLIAPEATAAVAHLLAAGYLYGELGIAHVRRFDEERGLTRRIKVIFDNAQQTVAGVNQRYHVVNTVKTGYEYAATQARELNSRYRITQKVDMGIAYALQRASQLAQTALENQTIASVVTSGREFIAQCAHAVDDTMRAARVEAHSLHPAVVAAGAGAQSAGEGTLPFPPASSSSSMEADSPVASAAGLAAAPMSAAAPVSSTGTRVI